MFEVILDSQLSSHDSALRAAWNSETTFLVLPDKVQIDEDWLVSAWEQIPTRLHKNHFALLTSGSTGQPKLVFGARDRARRLARELHSRQATEAVSQSILVLPLNYCYAFVNQWVWAQEFERSLVFTDGFSDPAKLKEQLVSAENASICFIGAHVSFIRQLFTGLKFPGVVTINFAGGLFPQGQIQDLFEYFPNARVFNNYGCTEAMPRLTVREWNEAEIATNIGRPLDGIQLKTGPDGQLLFQSDYSSVGYFDGARFYEIGPEDWTETGDVAAENADGSWQILGRKSEVFKRFGEKVSLPAIASVIESEHQMRANFYMETDANGEHAHVLVLSPTPEKSVVRKLLKTLRQNFTRIHWPVRIEGVDELPKLPNGKVDKIRLKTVNDKSILWKQRGTN